MNEYDVTVRSTMTEEATIRISATSAKLARFKIQELLDLGGWSAVFGDRPGDLIDCNNKVCTVRR